MTKHNYKFRRQTGVTLVELLIVIVIIIALSTVAVMQFGSSRQQLARQNIAQELKISFERARFDSVKRRANSSAAWAKVEVASASFTLTTDNNMDGDTADSGDSVTTGFAGQNISITSNNSTTLPATVYFNRRGETVDSGGNSISPIFLVCNATCTFNNDTSGNANIVLVTPTGTVNLLAGGSAVPSFSPPPVTSVSPGSGIRNEVTVP